MTPVENWKSARERRGRMNNHREGGLAPYRASFNSARKESIRDDYEV